jgi:plastocyanin
MMSTRMSARIFGLAMGALVAASAGTGAAQQLAKATPTEITIDNFAFAPATLTIPRGTQVTWINRDEEPHTVVSATKEQPFKSQALDTDDKFSFVFDKPGTFKYFCSIHTHMVGTIEVK